MLKYTPSLFLVLLFTFACSRDSGNQSTLYSGNTSILRETKASLDTRWEGTGYNPEGPVGLEGQTPPAFKDMSNLYGSVEQEVQFAPLYNSQEENALESSQINNEDRKLVKRANIRIRVEDLEAADSSITDLMEKYSAYSASTVIDESSHRYIIRVPSFAYKDFLAGMDSMGKVLNRSESAEDVTVRYYDLEGRLDTKKELLKTFQSYLGRARNIEEILSVEKRIAELQSDIDRTGKDLRNLSNSVDYATIELLILGPVVISPSYHNTILTDRIKELFSNFGNFLSGLTVALIGIVIYGIPILLLIFFFFWVLFGKIGLMKKLWWAVVDRKQKNNIEKK
jgi:hypothetical protein